MVWGQYFVSFTAKDTTWDRKTPVCLQLLVTFAPDVFRFFRIYQEFLEFKAKKNYTTVNEPACIVRDVLLWHCVVRSHGWNLESRRSVTNSVAEAAKKELEIDGKLCVMLPLILVIPQTGKFAPM